jgi:hypothetical protein
MKHTVHTLARLAALAASLALVAPSVAGAQIAPSDMIGTWHAPGAGTVSTVTIAQNGGAYTIRVQAACSPTPCDWGTRPLTIYAPSAGIGVGKVGSATFNQGFVSRIVIVTLQDATAPFLQVQVLSRFTPAGGRSNYTTVQTLH